MIKIRLESIRDLILILKGFFLLNEFQDLSKKTRSHNLSPSLSKTKDRDVKNASDDFWIPEIHLIRKVP